MIFHGISRGSRPPSWWAFFVALLRDAVRVRAARRRSTDGGTMTDTTDATVEEQTDGATPDEQLGDAGIAALKSEREARKAAEKERADLAARLKEIEDRDKSEAQRQAEALEAAKAELAEVMAAKVRAEVAAAKGVPVGLLNGSTQEELEASADALLEFRGKPAKPGLHLPNEGKTPRVTTGSTAEQFAAFMQDKL